MFKSNLFLSLTFLIFIFSGCDDSGKNKKTTKVQLSPSEWTYTLEESFPGLSLWTTPATHRVKSNEIPPEERSSGIHIFAAKNEYEPFQIIVNSDGKAISWSLTPFEGIDSNQKRDLFTAHFVEGMSENLVPYEESSLTSQNDKSIIIFADVYIPKTAPAGDHTATLSIVKGDKVASIPVTVTVFDFTLPDETHFATQLNISISNLLAHGKTVDDVKTMLFEHRMTPKSVVWPSGFNWDITWDNPNSPSRCETFYDEPDEPDEYSVGWLSKRYILGTGWNEIGFPNAMIFQFVNNQTPRPATFCGLDISDDYGTTQYNAEWSQFLSSLQTYLTDNNMIQKAYYYVQNEPQNQSDHDLAAFLCNLTKTAAPNLRIAISEEPKPEIAEGENGCGYDIWIAYIRNYNRDYAWKRQLENGEEVWFYSLDQDPEPFFNPTLTDRDGMNQRIIPWVSWHYRVKGWAYYDFNRFFYDSYPTIRAKLFREGFEDYEYLYLANNSSYPGVTDTLDIDQSVDSVASSLTGWTRNIDAFMSFRVKLGRYIEGSDTAIPLLESDNSTRPRGEYYINFQDKNGAPLDVPLTENGKTWIKVDWSAYSLDEQMGWYGENIDNSSIALYGYDDVSGYSEVEKSYLYDDYGRANLFEFGLQNGKYMVTVTVGRPAKGYPNDPHNLTVEGIKVVDDEVTTNENPVIKREVEIDLKDGSLSVEMGGKSSLTGEFSYTFISSIEIVPIP